MECNCLPTRACYNCLYDLSGHGSPALCPECGTKEIVAEVRTLTAQKLHSMRFLLLCPLTAALSRNVWKLCLFPEYTSVTRRSVSAVLIAAIVFALSLLVGSHLWSFARPVNGNGWIDRTWWYGGELDDVASNRVDRDISEGRLEVNARGLHGEQVVLFWSDTRTRLQRVDHTLVWRSLSSGWAWRSQLAPGLSRAVKYFWSPAGLLGACVWFIVLRTSLHHGTHRSLRVLMILASSLMPFMLTGLAVALAKCACLMWWCEPSVITILVWCNLVSALWPIYVYIRAGMSSPCPRWRKLLFGACAAPLILWCLVPFVVAGHAYSWV